MAFFLFLVLFLLREVTALSVAPSLASLSFLNVYRYPALSVADGIRHIHTPELLENLTWPHGTRESRRRSLPFFRIDRVEPPKRFGDRVSVGMQCTVAGQAHTIFAISSKASPTTCTYMCVREGCQRALVELTVSRSGGKGHRLSMGCTYLFGARTLDRDMEPVFRFLRFLERRMNSQPVMLCEPRANLQWYRRMILGLDHGQPGGEGPLD